MTLPSYIGRYEVRDEIASGGFAQVLRAWDEDLESLVALKILRRELALDDEVRLRFLEEARLLRRIRSPNVVTVHDVGRLNDGRPYFVMDFADRGTLAGRINDTPSSRARSQQSILALTDAVADGLSDVHDAGVVHRDIKPANILFQLAHRGTSSAGRTDAADGADRPTGAEDERILLGDLGFAKDLVKRAGYETMIGGTPRYQAPEQDDPAADITPAADVYAATATLWHLLTGDRPPRPGEVADRLTELPSAWRQAIGQGMSVDPEDRFATMDSWRSAIHDALAREASDVPSRVATERIEPASHCPYKGLAAYQPEDAGHFYGREALIDELVRRLRLHRVLVVGGPSGSGKSSLVRAGLVPALKAGALPGSEAWPMALFTPGRDPLAELYVRVTSALGGDRHSLALGDLMAHPTLARTLGDTDGSKRPLVLCIDQFEELFTLTPPAQRAPFVDALSAMTDPADSKVRVVISVRADFYAACAQLPWLAERTTENQVLVGPMTDAELRRAISEPARSAGLFVERGLVDAILQEAGHEAGSLPLVAHALVETWQRRSGNTLTLDGFRAAGGVAGAISQTAEVTFNDQFDARHRATTKRLFLRLVTPGEGSPDTRRVLARFEIDQDSEPDLMTRVVESLTEARLLTVDDASVQIAHEALLRTWPRLRDWIAESGDELRMRQRISRAAAEWDSEGRDSDLLYRGTPLLSALEWRGRNPDQLGELERGFLDASEKTRRQAEATARDRKRRTRRIRRAAVAALSILALSATVASLLAFQAFRESERNKEVAELATAQAHERFAGALGAAAHGLVETDPLLALFLAAEAVSRAETESPAFEARAAMIDARRVLAEGGPFVAGSPIAAGDALAVAMSPDGARLAAAQRNGNIDLIDAATGAQLGTSLRGHTGGVRDIEFGPHGLRLASVGADGTVRLWMVDGGPGDRSRRIGRTGDVVSGVSFGANGDVLASANGDGTVRLWNLAVTDGIGRTLIERTLSFKVVDHSPDGHSLVAGYNDGTIYGWTLPSGEPLFAPIEGVHTSNLSKLVVSPTGDHFATASTDGSSVVFEHPSGRIIGPAFGGDDRINAVVFTPDGRRLIGGATDGSVKVWDVANQEPILTTPSGHSQAIVDAEMSEDGRILATLGQDQLIRLWRLGDTYSAAIERRVAGQAAKGVAFSPDGRSLAAGDDGGAVQVWTIDTERDPVLLLGHEHAVWSVAFAPGGDWLASGDRSGQLHLWALESSTLQSNIDAHEGAIWSLAFIPNSDRLMTASDSEIRIWDVEAGTQIGELTPDGGRVTRAVPSHDGSLLAVTTSDGTVSIWNMNTESVVHEIAAEDDVVWSATFSPDNRHVAVASSDEVVTIWDLESERRVRRFTGLTGGATDLAYLADGVTLVVVDRSGALHFWDAETGRRLGEAWQGHARASWRLAVHPDGERFATAGDDGLVQIWDELSVSRACDIGRLGFDLVRHRQYLGEGERSVACDRGP